MSPKQAVSAAPGKALIRFKHDHYSQEFGPPTMHRKGDEIEVDAALASQLRHEYGEPTTAKVQTDDGGVVQRTTSPGCPFEIVAENKALAGADEKK